MVVGEAKPSSISISIPKSSEITESKVSSGCFAKAILVLGILSVIRMIIIARLPLTGDEAYYWQWSKHLALGYHDHPPLVGWLIRTTSIFGRSAFWVRFPSLVLSFLTSVFLYLFSREVWQSEKTAFQATLLIVAIPVFSVCALAIFPDGPLVFSWALFLWGSWKWLSNESYWPAMGLALGLAGLSKLMGFFLLPSFVLFLLFTDKSKLQKASFWKSVILALAICFPFLYWNANHHFETFTYQARKRITGGLSFSPSLFLNYTSLQLIALSPLMLILVVFTVGLLFRNAIQGDSRARFALAMALPIHLFFLALSLFTRVGLHWALPGYLSIFAAVPVWVDEMKLKGVAWSQTFYNAALATSLALTFFFFTLFLSPQILVPWISSLGIHHEGVNHGKKLTSQTMAEILGYRELGEQVNAYLEELKTPGSGDVFVFTDSYTLSSIISFYANVDAKTLLFNSTGGDYDRWNQFEAQTGRDALYVDTQPIGSRPDINRILRQAFLKVVPLSPLTVNRGAIEAEIFYFAHCTGLRHPEALRPHRPW